MRAARVVAALAVVVVLAPLAPHGGAQAQSLREIQEQLEAARNERSAIEDRLERAAAELDDLEARIAELEAELEQLERERRELSGILDALSAAIELRVRETFILGSTLDPLAVFLASEDPDGALRRAQTVQRLVAADRVRSEEVVAARIRLDAVVARVEERGEELAEAERRQREVAAEITADLERALQLERDLTDEEREERERLERERRRREQERLERERRERERRERERAAQQEATAAAAAGTDDEGASEGGGSGGLVCPLDRPRHFTDTWGAPRSGGRRHRGTDILGPYGIPVRAITSGVWSVQRPGRSAGNWGVLRGDDGNQYRYMHLQSHTVANGTRVSAGQQVATNGDTGNARGTPHLHFELHPGGGSAVNPYPLLRQVCG